MKRLKLYFWHGQHPDLEKRVVSLFPQGVWDDGYYILHPMTLDEFYAIWKSKFMVLPQHGGDELLIAITMHTSFSQR